MTEVLAGWWLLGPAGIVDLVTGADERIRVRGMILLSGGPTCHHRREEEVRRLTGRADPSVHHLANFIFHYSLTSSLHHTPSHAFNGEKLSISVQVLVSNMNI